MRPEKGTWAEKQRVRTQAQAKFSSSQLDGPTDDGGEWVSENEGQSRHRTPTHSNDFHLAHTHTFTHTMFSRLGATAFRAIPKASVRMLNAVQESSGSSTY